MDVGNGGHFAYDVSTPRRVIATDISRVILEHIEDPRIEKLVGDARDLSGVEDDSLDVILFVFSLHHMAGSNVRDSFETLDRILASAGRVLRPGGHLIFAEPVLGPVLFRVERLVFPLLRWFLKRKGVDMIFFYSAKELIQRAAASIGISDRQVESNRLPVEGWIDPLGGSFPGVLRIPAWLHPLRYQLFIVPIPDVEERVT